MDRQHMFDSRKFLSQTFQTPQHTHTMLRVYGYEGVSQAAVEKWFQRESVPGHWLPILIAIREIETGEAVSVAPFLKGGLVNG